MSEERAPYGNTKPVPTRGDFIAGFEATLEQVRVLQQFVRLLLEKMETGERLSDAALADYRRQLRTIDAQRERLGQMLLTLRHLPDRDPLVQ